MLTFEENLKRRREYVTERFKSGAVLNAQFKRETAKLFNCSESAIYADWAVIARAVDTGLCAVTPALRRKVKLRDAHTCQYCGEVSENLYMDHVIPAANGGVTDFYNIVCACAWCNARKGRSVWIPSNLNDITADYPEWKSQILLLAVAHRPGRKKLCDEVLQPWTIRVTSDEKNRIKEFIKEIRKASKKA